MFGLGASCELVGWFSIGAHWNTTLFEHVWTTSRPQQWAHESGDEAAPTGPLWISVTKCASMANWQTSHTANSCKNYHRQYNFKFEGQHILRNAPQHSWHLHRPRCLWNQGSMGRPILSSWVKEKISWNNILLTVYYKLWQTYWRQDQNPRWCLLFFFLCPACALSIS